MAQELQVNPTFGSRKWVKLWVNEWLDGTTRFEMTDAQRAFWIDLMAMAGRSRFPGIICAGQIDGQFIGYPINKFQALMSEAIDVEATLALFERNHKIEIEITQENPTKLYKLTLQNWDRYQSEYQRQKKYRLQKSDTPGYSKSNTTEVRSRSEKIEENHKPRSNGQKAPVVPNLSSNKNLTPQQKDYSDVSRLLMGAVPIISKAREMKKSIHSADVKEDLKEWAVKHGIPYNVDSIAKALDIAEQKTK
jgi:hypothetical protein